MNPSPRPPSDAELDRLLAARLRRTSPEFELRWRELRAGFGARPARRPLFAGWWLWSGLASAGAAALAAFLVVRTPPAPAPARTAAFEELVALDAVLAPAAVLLEPETRDAVLHLPASSNL